MIRRRLPSYSLFLLLAVLPACVNRSLVRIVDGAPRVTRSISPTAYEHYLRAEIFTQRGAYGDAVGELRAALIFDEDSPYIFARLADALMAQGDLEAASQAIRRGLSLDATSPDVLLSDAALYAKTTRPAQAERSLRRCVSAAPADERCFIRLAHHLAARGESTKARVLLRSLQKAAPSVRGLIAHAKICSWTLDLRCADAQLSRALAKDERLQWLLSRARVQQASGAVNGAIASWRRAFDRSGGALKIARALVATLDLARRNTERDDLFLILERQRGARKKGGVALARLMLDTGHPARALAWLNRVASKLPAVKLAQAEALYALGRREAMNNALRDLRGGPLSTSAALLLGRDAERRGQPQLALSMLQRHRGDHKAGRRAQRESARLLIDTGRIKAGLTLARSVARTSKRGIHTRLALAAALERAKRHDAALAEAEKALKAHPDDPIALNFVGYLLTTRGLQMTRARALLHRAHRIAPLESYILDSLGVWSLRAKRFDEAFRWLEAAHRLAPRDPEIAEHLADARAQKSNRSGALSLLKEVISITSDGRQIVRLRNKIEVLSKSRAAKARP